MDGHKYVACRKCYYKDVALHLEHENKILRQRLSTAEHSKQQYQKLFNMCPWLIRGIVIWIYSKKS